MNIVADVLSILLALAVAGAGFPKLLNKGSTPAQLREHLKVRAGLVPVIGLAEVAAAVGLITGVFWHPLGIAAAVGLVLVFVGAVGYHGRAGDYNDPKARGGAMGPIVLGLISAAAIVTLGLSL
ncbi:DoxX family protein [Streptomyces sp. NPDC090499]|uniref:DoxX family protein n=1 Tax=Streptomyces sp. NPDC090499 TaxID=3365965 RepID=UPI003812DC4C